MLEDSNLQKLPFVQCSVNKKASVFIAKKCSIRLNNIRRFSLCSMTSEHNFFVVENVEIAE